MKKKLPMKKTVVTFAQRAHIKYYYELLELCLKKTKGVSITKHLIPATYSTYLWMPVSR